MVADGSVVVTKIETFENPADILTKSVPVKKFEEGRNRLRVLSDRRVISFDIVKCSKRETGTGKVNFWFDRK